MAFESLTRFKSVSLDISCFISVLHGDMCPFCPNFGYLVGGIARLPPPLDQPLPFVILSRSGRLVRTAIKHTLHINLLAYCVGFVAASNDRVK